MAGGDGLYNGGVAPVRRALRGGDPLKVTVGRQKNKQEAQALRQKALEPQTRHCFILDIDVNVLVEYVDYRGPHNKGPEGELYCENIVPCYQANRRCRYSGISPLFPDPFLPREKPGEDEERAEAEPEDLGEEDLQASDSAALRV